MDLNANALVKWFQIKYPAMVKSMKECNHHYSKENLNPYHLESDVFTHTMMVVKQVENNIKPVKDNFYNSIIRNSTLVAALLHDIGKSLCRKADLDKKKVSFIGHDSASAFLAVRILSDIEKEFDIGLDKDLIIQAIALHTEVFKLDKEKLEQRLADNTTLSLILSELSTADHQGRFHEHEEKLDYKLNPPIKFPNETDREITVYIGLPCSGKSTSLNKMLSESKKELEVVSRDEIVLKLGAEKGFSSYGESWANIDHTLADKMAREAKDKALKDNKNIAIDMTSLTRKSRRKILNNVPSNYKKIAVVLMADIMEIFERNEKRKETGKYISEQAYENMMKCFYPPLYDEFDEIIWEIY